MAEYLAPVLAGVLDVLTRRTPDLCAAAGLPAFQAVARGFRGVVANVPALYVQPGRTDFAAEGTLVDQLHTLDVVVAVAGADPAAVVDAAVAYLGVVTHAILDAEPAEFGAVNGVTALDGVVRRVFVAEHDYGPLRTNGTGYGAFPSLSLLVEVTEQ